MFLQLILKSQKQKILIEAFITQSPYQELATIETRAILKKQTDQTLTSIRETFANTIQLSCPFKAIELKDPSEFQLIMFSIDYSFYLFFSP